MEQLKDLSDDRLFVGCAYCDEPTSTRDHVPSRVFLDAPFPENLPVVAACESCNRGFSLDEEYVACLIEVALAGSTDPADIRRESIARTLRHSRPLRESLEGARSEDRGQTVFAVDEARVANVMLKLARGHAAFELGIPQRKPPSALSCLPLSLLPVDARETFNAAHVTELYGEIGSRGFQRTILVQVPIVGPTEDQACLNLVV